MGKTKGVTSSSSSQMKPETVVENVILDFHELSQPIVESADHKLLSTDWNCPQCTLLNEGKNRFCSACGYKFKSIASKKKKRDSEDQIIDKHNHEETAKSFGSDVKNEIETKENTVALIEEVSLEKSNVVTDPSLVPVGSNWLCPQCTCENEYKNRYCSACSYYFRKIVKPKKQKVNDESDNAAVLETVKVLQTMDEDGPAAVPLLHTESEDVADSELGTKKSKHHRYENWTCPQCTFENAGRNRYCDACGFLSRIVFPKSNPVIKNEKQIDIAKSNPKSRNKGGMTTPPNEPSDRTESQNNVMTTPNTEARISDEIPTPKIPSGLLQIKSSHEKSSKSKKSSSAKKSKVETNVKEDDDTDRQEEDTNPGVRWACHSCNYENRQSFVSCLRCGKSRKRSSKGNKSSAHGKSESQTPKLEAESKQVERHKPLNLSSDLMDVAPESKDVSHPEKLQNEIEEVEISKPIQLPQSVPSLSIPPTSLNPSQTPFLLSPFYSFPFMNPLLAFQLQQSLANANPAFLQNQLQTSPFLFPQLLSPQMNQPSSSLLRSVSNDSGTIRINSDFAAPLDYPTTFQNLSNPSLPSNPLDSTLLLSQLMQSQFQFPSMNILQGLSGFPPTLLNQAPSLPAMNPNIQNPTNLNNPLDNIMQFYQKCFTNNQMEGYTNLLNSNNSNNVNSNSSNNQNTSSEQQNNKYLPASPKNEVSNFFPKNEDLVNDCASDLTTASTIGQSAPEEGFNDHHYLASTHTGAPKSLVGPDHQAFVPDFAPRVKPRKTNLQKNNQYYDVIWMANPDLLDLPEETIEEVAPRPKRRTRSNYTAYPFHELPPKSPKSLDAKISSLNDFAECFPNNPVTALNVLYTENYDYEAAKAKLKQLEEEKRHSVFDVALVILNKEEREKFKRAITKFGDDDWNQVAVSDLIYVFSSIFLLKLSFFIGFPWI